MRVRPCRMWHRREHADMKGGGNSGYVTAGSPEVSSFDVTHNNFLKRKLLARMEKYVLMIRSGISSRATGTDFGAQEPAWLLNASFRRHPPEAAYPVKEGFGHDICPPRQALDRR